MKKLILLFLICVTLPAFSQTEKTYPTKKERKAFYKQFSQKYSGAAVQEIFNSDTEDDFERYVEGFSEKELLKEYDVVIHELLHGYNNTINDGHNYFIEPGIRIYVPFSKYFNSKELNSYVKKGVQDSILRYGLYVGAKSSILGYSGPLPVLNTNEDNEVMSVSQGIYGLVEEFNAYYYGHVASMERLNYYLKTIGANETDEFEDYRSDIMAEAVPYYEFNLFIAYYLLYAKDKHPDIYTEIINNNSLRVVFTLIDNKYKKLVDEAQKKSTELNKDEDPEPVVVLDFSGSDKDFMLFYKYYGFDALDYDEEEFQALNITTMASLKAKLNSEEVAQLKKEYQDLKVETKEEMGESILFFYAMPELQIKYVNKQFTKALRAELEKLRIKDLNITNYKSFMK